MMAFSSDPPERPHPSSVVILVLFLVMVLASLPMQRVAAAPGSTSRECPLDSKNLGRRIQCVLSALTEPSVEDVAIEMAANPKPHVVPIPVDERQLFGRAYRRVLKATDIYDAPNGTVVGHLDAGFNFVNAGRRSNGWVMLRVGQWIPEEVLGPLNKSVSKFAGVLLPEGMPVRPFGWLLLDTKPSKLPGEKPLRETSALKRYTLVNIFEIKEVDGWDWYLIGPDQWIVQTSIAKLTSVKRPEGVSGKWFAVDLYEQTLIAFEDDTPVFATLISSGLPKWSTSEGVFQIWDRYENVKMSGATGQPDFYYLPQVPWVMYFNKEEQALHGTYWHDGFGYRRSHGCVNMSITDAMWAFKWTEDSPSAYVYVYHSGEYKNGVPR